MKNRTVVLALVLGLLVGGAGVALLVVTEDDDGTALDAGLPKLPSVLGGERTSAAADMSMAVPVTYEVRGELPDLPDHARAYRTAGEVDEADARRLAGALGLDGEVKRARDGWEVVDGDQRLVVGTSSAGAWSFGPAEECVERLEADPDSAASCTVSSPELKCPPEGPCEEPPRRTDLPSQEDARRIAVDALEKGGIDTSGSVQVLQAFDAWEVLTERRIDGRRTHGLSTHLSVGPKGELIRGGGLLGAMEEVGDYPLVDVQAGVERLRGQAVPDPMLYGGREPAIAIAPVPPDGGGPMVRTITDAELGLMPVYVDERTWLEPAFLFELDDKDTVAVPAVIDALLEAPFGQAPPPPPGPPGQVDPAPPSDGGGSGGSGGGGSGGSQTCAGSAAASSSDADGDNQALTVEVCAAPSRAAVGETVTFTFKAHDPDAAIDADGCQQPRAAYGDESEGTAQCLALCSRDTYPPEATTLAKTFTHAYARPGTYTATFTVGSCAPKASSGQVEVQITVTG